LDEHDGNLPGLRKVSERGYFPQYVREQPQDKPCTMVGYLYHGEVLRLNLIVLCPSAFLDEEQLLRSFRECAAHIATAAGEPALEKALLKAGGWLEVEGKLCVADGSIMKEGTTLALAHQWIETQPIVATHWKGQARALHAEMECFFLNARVRDVKALPQVSTTLAKLRAFNVKLAFFTNETERIARAQLHRLELAHFFDFVFAADDATNTSDMPASSIHASPIDPSYVDASALFGVSARLVAAIESVSVPPQQVLLVTGSAVHAAAATAAGTISMAVHPKPAPLPAVLASCTCRMESLKELVSLLQVVQMKNVAAHSAAPSHVQLIPMEQSNDNVTEIASSSDIYGIIDPDISNIVEAIWEPTVRNRFSS